MNEFPVTEVNSKDGVVCVNVRAPIAHESTISEKIMILLKNIEEIKEVRTNCWPHLKAHRVPVF